MIFCTENKGKVDSIHGLSKSRDHGGGVSLSGIVVIDKKPGLSSFAAVSEVKKILGVRKAGHTGTLDPFATGVLVVCLEQATRIIPFLEEKTKTYRYTICFGAETDTWDLTGKVIREVDVSEVASRAVEDILLSLTGDIELPVPRFSAIRRGGKRLYEMARKGIEFELPWRITTIYRMELVDFKWPEIVVETECEKGTYIRSIAHIIGKKLGIPGYVKELKRLCSGRFGLEEAISEDALRELVKCGVAKQRIIPMNSALSHLPFVKIDRAKAEFIRKGGAQAVKLEVPGSATGKAPHVRVVSDNSDLVAIASIAGDKNFLKIIRVFPHYNAF